MTKLSKDLEKAADQFNKFDEEVKALTFDRMNEAPLRDVEPQSDILKVSQKEKDRRGSPYLKPIRTISSREKFNEAHREDYNYAKELVHFEAENLEIIGESIDVWSKPFPGMPAEEWMVPVNTPVWGPRYLAEQLTKCSYHKLKMHEKEIVGGDGHGTYTGKIVVDETTHRLNARPVLERRSVFMGASAR